MIPVFPYRIRRGEDRHCAEMLLRIREEAKAYVLRLPIERAGPLVVEMHGLAHEDLCARHHLASDVLKAAGVRIKCVIIRELRQGWVVGTIRLENNNGIRDVDVDLPTALGMAIHLGLPIFLDHQNALSETVLPMVDIPEDSCPSVQIPPTFLKAIEDLDIPFPNEGKSCQAEE